MHCRSYVNFIRSLSEYLLEEPVTVFPFPDEVKERRRTSFSSFHSRWQLPSNDKMSSRRCKTSSGNLDDGGIPQSLPSSAADKPMMMSSSLPASSISNKGIDVGAARLRSINKSHTFNFTYPPLQDLSMPVRNRDCAAGRRRVSRSFSSRLLPSIHHHPIVEAMKLVSDEDSIEDGEAWPMTSPVGSFRCSSPKTPSLLSHHQDIRKAAVSSVGCHVPPLISSSKKENLDDVVDLVLAATNNTAYVFADAYGNYRPLASPIED